MKCQRKFFVLALCIVASALYGCGSSASENGVNATLAIHSVEMVNERSESSLSIMTIDSQKKMNEPPDIVIVRDGSGEDHYFTYSHNKKGEKRSFIKDVWRGLTQ